MNSPTQRSMKHLRDGGWYPEITEHWNPWTKRKYDLFGFADILAIKDGQKPLLVQTTTGSNLAARRTKILGSEIAPLTIQGGFRIILHGWRKVKVKRGGKAMVWELREEEMPLSLWETQPLSGVSIRAMGEAS